jgi:hypothetical protein
VKPPWEPHSLQRLSTLGGSENTTSKPKLKAKELQRKYGCPSWSLLPQSVGKKESESKGGGDEPGGAGVLKCERGLLLSSSCVVP